MNADTPAAETAEFEDRLRPENLPRLALFLSGYLHEDLAVVHGSAARAAWEYAAEAEIDELGELAGEWQVLAAAARRCRSRASTSSCASVSARPGRPPRSPRSTPWPRRSNAPSPSEIGGDAAGGQAAGAAAGAGSSSTAGSHQDSPAAKARPSNEQVEAT